MKYKKAITVTYEWMCTHYNCEGCKKGFPIDVLFLTDEEYSTAKLLCEECAKKLCKDGELR